MTLILGCDPGLDGGWVVIDHNGEVIVKDVMSTYHLESSRHYNLSEINSLLTSARPNYVYFEKPLRMPMNGKFSYGSLMRCQAIFEMACHIYGIPFVLVSPSVWVREILKDYPNEKKASVLFAQRQYPKEDWFKSAKSKKPHTGLTDALCIALYGLAEFKRSGR